MGSKMQLFENQPVRAEVGQEQIEENPKRLSHEGIFGVIREGLVTDELEGVLEEESGNTRMEELKKKYGYGRTIDNIG